MAFIFLGGLGGLLIGLALSSLIPGAGSQAATSVRGHIYRSAKRQDVDNGGAAFLMVILGLFGGLAAGSMVGA